jgi:hypothetical protein
MPDSPTVPPAERLDLDIGSAAREARVEHRTSLSMAARLASVAAIPLAALA